MAELKEFGDKGGGFAYRPAAEDAKINILGMQYASLKPGRFLFRLNQPWGQFPVNRKICGPSRARGAWASLP
jgi:hypothetical protein